MKLRLNLSTSPQENNRPFLALAPSARHAWVARAVVLSLAAYPSWQSNRELRADIAIGRSEIRADHAETAGPGGVFSVAAAQQVFDRAAFLNSLIDERSFPWTKIFMDLEKTLPPGVRVVSISPQLVNGRAEVQLEVGAIERRKQDPVPRGDREIARFFPGWK